MRRYNNILEEQLDKRLRDIMELTVNDVFRVTDMYSNYELLKEQCLYTSMEAKFVQIWSDILSLDEVANLEVKNEFQSTCEKDMFLEIGRDNEHIYALRIDDRSLDGLEISYSCFSVQVENAPYWKKCDKHKSTLAKYYNQLSKKYFKNYDYLYKNNGNLAQEVRFDNPIERKMDRHIRELLNCSFIEAFQVDQEILEEVTLNPDILFTTVDVQFLCVWRKILNSKEVADIPVHNEFYCEEDNIRLLEIERKDAALCGIEISDDYICDEKVQYKIISCHIEKIGYFDKIEKPGKTIGDYYDLMNEFYFAEYQNETDRNLSR